MHDTEPMVGHEIRRTIDQETDLVLSAVNLVAAGGARAATVAGLRLGEAVISIVRPGAAARGIRLEPLWAADEAGLDIRVARDPA